MILENANVVEVNERSDESSDKNLSGDSVEQILKKKADQIVVIEESKKEPKMFYEFGGW